VDLETILNNPSNYTIHREPIVRFTTVSIADGSIGTTHPSEDKAANWINGMSGWRVIKLVEDLNWKPEVAK
jgi:hypothetical protein